MHRGEKGIIGDLLTYLIVAVTLIIMVSLISVFRQVSDNNAVVEYAGNVVARYGGMTDSAKEEITDYLATNYGARYVILTEVMDPVPYGTVVTFALQSDVHTGFINLPMTLRFGGSAVSRRR